MRLSCGQVGFNPPVALTITARESLEVLLGLGVAGEVDIALESEDACKDSVEMKSGSHPCSVHVPGVVAFFCVSESGKCYVNPLTSRSSRHKDSQKRTSQTSTVVSKLEPALLGSTKRCFPVEWEPMSAINSRTDIPMSANLAVKTLTGENGLGSRPSGLMLAGGVRPMYVLITGPPGQAN